MDYADHVKYLVIGSPKEKRLLAEYLRDNNNKLFLEDVLV